MSQWMLAIWSPIPLPFLNSTCKSRSAQFTYCWSPAWSILMMEYLDEESWAIEESGPLGPCGWDSVFQYSFLLVGWSLRSVFAELYSNLIMKNVKKGNQEIWVLNLFLLFTDGPQLVKSSLSLWLSFLIIKWRFWSSDFPEIFSCFDNPVFQNFNLNCPFLY